MQCNIEAGEGPTQVQNTRSWGNNFWLCLKSAELERQSSGKAVYIIVSIKPVGFHVGFFFFFPCSKAMKKTKVMQPKKGIERLHITSRSVKEYVAKDT